MFRSLFLMMVIVLASGHTAYAQSLAPNSPKAIEAKQKYDTAQRQAREAYLKAIIAADQQYIFDLDAAVKDAMRAQDIDLARALDDQKKAAIELLERDRAELESKITGGNSASVTYIGEVAHTGPTATVKFSSNGYDLYGTAPLNSGSIFRDGAFAAGNRLTKLPTYVTSITAPQGVAVVSAAGFGDYSIINDPTHPTEQIRAGFETTYALNETTSAPLVEINVGPNVPATFYVGFMTNTHANRPDDYPTTITISVGNTQAIAKTGQGGGTPSGDIDVFFFRIDGAQAGDKILVSASQSIRNPNGGRLNPSVSGLLFTTTVPLASHR